MGVLDPNKTQLTGSNVELVELSLDESTVVGAGATRNVTVTAPAGQLGTVLGMFLTAGGPPGATTGTHQYQLKSGSVEFMLGRGAFGSTIRFRRHHWENADSVQLPSGADAQGQILTNIQFSESQPLTIEYINSTDQPTSGTRSIKLLVRYEGVTT